ncbi:SGNH/GDSL hydrolase family protein [Pontiellaceae bacterium B12227]|nr:SGNH/GDSL hydrolase family protein [Pontiellaceae bacterium B12227]
MKNINVLLAVALACGATVFGAQKKPMVANTPIEIRCSVAPVQSTDGVLVAQGGRGYGYAVYVQNAVACFSVRIKNKLTTIKSLTPAPAAPFELVAVLAEGGMMSLKIDEVEVAVGSAGSLIPTQPGMGLSVGKDTSSPVGTYELPFAYPGKVSELFINGEAYAVPAARPTAFYTPKQDMDGLKKAVIKAGLPNVLMIGDSISIGYTPPVIDLLKDVANVQRVKTNCGDTQSGMRNLKRWLGTTPWDIIHFNWGLHDLCYRHPDSRVYGNRDKVNGTIAVPLEQYEQNLEKLVLQLEKTGAKLIWASTTVVPEGEAGRFPEDVIKYNAAAERIMQKHDVAIDDLYALTATFPPAFFSCPGDVHYTAEGYQELARQVANSIKAELN